jgi:uncharacterized protein involved in oxidation of intracellular sulfur
MSVLLVVNSAPYGSEGPYNAFRLADALALRGEHVEVFLMGDAVAAAAAGQDPRGAHASLEHHLVELLKKGVDVSCCGTCCATRGPHRRTRARGHDPRPGRGDRTQRPGRLVLRPLWRVCPQRVSGSSVASRSR